MNTESNPSKWKTLVNDIKYGSKLIRKTAKSPVFVSNILFKKYKV
jgi:tetrahydromethanopterin S-methyltransferase subunit F